MMLGLIPLCPLIAFAILILVGRRLGKLSSAVSLLALAGSLTLSLIGFHQLRTLHQQLHWVWNWLPFGNNAIRLGLQMDPLSATMCLVVTIIGWLIMLYSVGYMGEDPRFSRFFAYLSLFFTAMLTLVLADNLLLLYIGWEGVGLCSYLLISFWFERPAAANAGKKAFLTTRIGDLGLLAGILLMVRVTGDLSFSDLPAKANALGSWAPVVALLIFWGAVGKSAQFPLHVWLPDAMEGPTPVSALIHAATMVAAGIYLVARTLPLFLTSATSMLAVATIGGITSFFAATIACTQTDLKRVLAYSTLSQLGFMMMGLGCGSAFAGMFHLVTHAWFKALLFLGAGSVIHVVHHQEITRMGGLWRSMPVTAATFTLGAVTMAGVPPFSGFWSKEEILMNVARFSPANFPTAGTLFLAVGLGTSLLTAFYITRAVLLTFFGTSRAAAGHGHDAHPPHESPFVMTGPLLLLCAGALGIGWIGTPWGGHAFQHFLGVEPAHHGGPEWILVASIGVGAAGILAAFLRYALGVQLLPAALRSGLSGVYRLVANKYYIDELYEKVFVQPVLAFARRAFSFDGNVIDGAVNGAGRLGLWTSRQKGWVDQVIVDGAVNGMATAVGWAGGAVRRIQTGLVQNYLLIAAAGAITLFWVLQWK